MEKKMSALRWAMIQFNGRFWQVLGLFGISLSFAFVEWLGPRMLETLVNSATEGRMNYLALSLYLLILAVTTLPILFWYTRRLITAAGFDLEQRVMKHLMNLDAQFYDQNQPVELREELQKGVGATNRLLYTFTANAFIVQIPLAIFAAWFIAQHDLRAVFLLGAFMVVFLFGGARIGKVIAKSENEENDFDTVLTRKRQEVINHMLFLKQQVATGTVYSSLRKDDEDQLSRSYYLTKLYSLFDLLSGQASFVSGVVMVLFFLPQVVSGSMSSGTLFAIYMYCTMVTNPALAWGDIYSQVKSSWAEAETLVDFFAKKSTVVDAPNAIWLKTLHQEIRFESVSFAYPNTTKPVLHDVSFVIPKGKMTAIVGGSGGGKSTIAKLLLRQYDPLVGQVLFDEVALKEATQDSLFSRVAYLQQKVPLFTGSVRDNVNLKTVHSDEVILQACKTAQANFALVEGGLDRKVSELSGGEEQRLALARMLLQGCSVVVLDEATSALDQATERSIVEVLDKLCQNDKLTQVVIAHRLSTVQHADQIIVMEGGRVVAVGTDQELRQSSEVYQNLCTTFVREED